MEKIYSKISDNNLLHIIIRKQDINKERVNVSPDAEFLQLAAKRIDADTVYESHYHLFQERISDITQEAWVVIDGSIKIYYYDIDKVLLGEAILNSGDCFITFRGGHGMKITKQDTIMYEFKLGPYCGQKKDKEFI